jgi:hypothetical protein
VRNEKDHASSVLQAPLGTPHSALPNPHSALNWSACVGTLSWPRGFYRRNATIMSEVKSVAKRPSSANRAICLWFVLLPLYPVVGIAAIHSVDAHFGAGARVTVGVIIFAGFFVYLRWLYRLADRISAWRRAEIRETYRGIYRVKAAPSSQWSWLKENIQVGDYAWERPPWRRDELIYLHGLQEQWGVVWMAGFRREDVEYVTAKPVSEYDWRDFDYEGAKPRAPYQWGMAKAKTLCPFAVSTENRRVLKWRFPV